MVIQCLVCLNGGRVSCVRWSAWSSCWLRTFSMALENTFLHRTLQDVSGVGGVLRYRATQINTYLLTYVHLEVKMWNFTERQRHGLHGNNQKRLQSDMWRSRHVKHTHLRAIGPNGTVLAISDHTMLPATRHKWKRNA